MKTASERLKDRMKKQRIMTSISLRIPENVIDDLKEIAPSLGFTGYQSLIKAYISEGLRKDLQRLDGSQVQALTESLRKQGIDIGSDCRCRTEDGISCWLTHQQRTITQLPLCRSESGITDHAPQLFFCGSLSPFHLHRADVVRAEP